MDKNKWTSDAVSEAVLKNNVHLEAVVSNYFESFINRLSEYDINVQDITDIDDFHQKVLEGIEKLESLRKDFISVVEMFAPSRHPLLSKYLPNFFERLLNYYEDAGIDLYPGTEVDALRHDHYRFFNQHLFISLTALLLENRCFDVLMAILCGKFNVYDKSCGTARNLNFIRFREYNYTLNDFLNTRSPKRISVTADYIMKYTGQRSFDKLVRADILLYYISLWNCSGEKLESYWCPELSVYNRESSILPYMASRSYFEQAKRLFKVETVAQYKQMLDETTDPLNRGGLYRVPALKTGLMYETVGSVE